MARLRVALPMRSPLRDRGAAEVRLARVVVQKRPHLEAPTAVEEQARCVTAIHDVIAYLDVAPAVGIDHAVSVAVMLHKVSCDAAAAHVRLGVDVSAITKCGENAIDAVVCDLVTAGECDLVPTPAD